MAEANTGCSGTREWAHVTAWASGRTSEGQPIKEECKGVRKGLKVINVAGIYLVQTRERLLEKKAETRSKKTF